jgi:hypothetical protein
MAIVFAKTNSKPHMPPIERKSFTVNNVIKQKWPNKKSYIWVIYHIDWSSIVCHHYLMAIDWTKLVVRYKGSWVALDEDEITVLGSGKTAKKAFLEAYEKGYERPILTRIPDRLVPYIGRYEIFV